MKSRLQLYLLTLAFALGITGFNQLVAQPHFTLDSIIINPVDATDIEDISIRLVGHQTDSCSYLDSIDYAVLGFDLDIYMDWDTLPDSPLCDSMMVAWETTFSLDVLAAGTYTINLLGSNYADSSNHALSFTVSPNGGACGSSSIIWVTSAADNGPGSLREAIQCANSTPGSEGIYFNIPGLGDHIINVGSVTGDSLPALIGTGISIDGTTQPGYGVGGDFSPRIILTGENMDATGPFNGLEILGSNNGIFGLEIKSFPYNGIYINNSSTVTIGSPGKGNIIFNNGSPIDIFPNYDPVGPYEGSGVHIRNTNGVLIAANIIGTNENLSNGEGNEYAGIFIEGTSTNISVGGNTTNRANIIAYNPSGLVVQGNDILVSIEKNQFFCNSDQAIDFLGNVNDNIQVPMINLVTASMIQGTAALEGEVDVYLSDDEVCSNTPCQGYIYLGTAPVVNGSWSLMAPFAHGDTIISGQQVVTQAQDDQNQSSLFSLCGIGSGISACTDSIGQILVTNTADEGAGSLRAAMICADTTVGSNLIKFDIPGTGPHIIFVGATTGLPLPTITDIGTIIDGTSQPGYGNGGNFTPQIILNGGNTTWTTPFDGILINGDYTRIAAIELVNFPNNAIKIDGVNNCTLSDNVIFSNGAVADMFPGVPGQGPFEGSGIVLDGAAQGNRIYNNYIGTNYAQTITTGNEYCGILLGLDCDNNEIGGPNNGNIIAHNAEGIRVKDLSTLVLISQNSIYCNDTIAIELEGLANDTLPQTAFSNPNSTSTTLISGFISAFVTTAGTQLLGASIELFLNDDTDCAGAPCQGKTFLGSSPLTSGSWQITAPFEGGVTLENGDMVTAIFIDGNGNTSEFSECYIVADCMLGVAPSVVDETCGEDNGSITFITSGGPAPYIYDMGLGVTQSSNFFDNLNEGTYSVTVTDAYNCTTTASATLTDSPVPTVSVGNEQGEICDMINGSFIATGSNGTTPYLYDIGFGASGPNFFGLVAGSYIVTVSDVHGCTDTEQVTIPAIAGPNLVVANTTDESCTENNGIINFNTTSGTPNFSYTIGFGNQNNPNFDGLAAGNYTATVTDDNGCTDTSTASIINIPGPNSAGTTNVNNPNCGNPDGSFTVTVDGGTEPLVYDFGDGPMTSPNLSGLTAGSYVVTITDDNFCTITTSVTLTDIPGPNLDIVSINDANCGQANGSVTVQGSGSTAPYVYNVGNGNQSNPTLNGLSAGTYDITVTDGNGCTTVEMATVNDILGPSLSISNQVDESCEQANGSVTIFATSGTSPYIYNIGTGNTSSPTFNGLVAGSYTVTVTDAATCQSLQEVTIINTGTFPIAGYMYGDLDGTVTFSNTSMNANSYSWDFGEGGSSSIPDPIYSYTTSGTYNVCLEATNACGPTTYCEMITVIVPPSIVTISGQIEKETGALVGTTDMFCTGQATIENNTNGTYAFDMITVGGNYEVTPVKDTLYGNGVSTFDVFLIQKHILTIDTLDSPYLIIAADVNNNGGVSTFDTYRMQQVILANVDTFPNNTSWRFVPKDYTFIDPEFPLNENFPESINYTNIQADAVDQDFIAIKIGDVTLNADPTFGPSNDGELEVTINDQSLHTGDLVEVVLTLAEAKNLAAMQMELNFDPSALELEQIVEADVAGMNANSFGQRYLEEGRLIFAWYDTEGYGQYTDTGSALFKLQFKAKTNKGQLSDYLKLTATNRPNLAFQNDGSSFVIKTSFNTSTATTSAEKGYSLQSSPNPFATFTQVQITLPAAEFGTIKVYDISGKVFFQEEMAFEKGVNHFRIKAEDLPAAGLYYLQVQTEGFMAVEKLLLGR